MVFNSPSKAFRRLVEGYLKAFQRFLKRLSNTFETPKKVLESSSLWWCLCSDGFVSIFYSWNNPYGRTLDPGSFEGASGGHQQSSIGGEAPNIPSHVLEKPPKNPRLQCSHLTCFKPGIFKPRPEKDFYRGLLEALGFYSTGELPHGSREGSMLPIGFIRIPETLWSL